MDEQTESAVSARNNYFVYCATIFVGAFLLFQIQPVIAKLILPWFGGAPSVWTICMLFFQLLLLAGYFYAHIIFRHVPPQWQAIVHVVFLVVSAALLSIRPDSSWKPLGEESPTFHILALLLVHIGFPYFLLSTTSPLIQAWFSRRNPGVSPYRLYALSNAGSLIALLSFPFFVEPALTSTLQTQFWSWGYYLFFVLCSVCAFLAFRGNSGSLGESNKTSKNHPSPQSSEPVAAGRRILWFSLAAVGSTLLLAATNHVCHDVAVIPFLWIVPLSLYLLTFVICFESDKWYSRKKYTLFYAAFLLLLSDYELAAIVIGIEAGIICVIFASFALLFVCCMVCHGELAHLKPHADHLTSYYLMISAGGAAGGIFVGLIAPHIFSSYLEFPLGLILVGLLILFIMYHDRNSGFYRGNPRRLWIALVCAYLLTSAAMLNSALRTRDENVVLHDQTKTPKRALLQTRNFYGILRVSEADRGLPKVHRRKLYHGRILHGMQFVAAENRREPTTYFGRRSGAGLAFRHLLPQSSRKIGIVGLGVGTLAAYIRKQDALWFYEIDPDVIDIAEEYFTYLRDSPGKIEVIPGDARLSLEREESREFDLFVLDAFSGDAIPVHLLTKEAFDIYLRHLKPGGIIALHISNRHLDLRPVILGLAGHFNLSARMILSEGNTDKGLTRTLWMLLAPDEGVLAIPQSQNVVDPERSDVKFKRLWTDDFSNLFQLLR